MIRQIEELSINAWPAFQTMTYGGWVLRFADGCTRRANSISPLYTSERNLQEQIRECETIYSGKKLPTIFKMIKACQPPELDAILSQKGYIDEARTSVQLLNLNIFQFAEEADVSLSSEMKEDWEEAFYLLNKVDKENQKKHGKILSNIVPAKCFASIRNKEGRIVSCGLGVLQNKHVGLFDIVTSENCRRQGLGKKLIQQILRWAKEQGAHTSYLQVMKNNMPAQILYNQLGFKEEYEYWYRVKKLGAK